MFALAFPAFAMASAGEPATFAGLLRAPSPWRAMAKGPNVRSGHGLLGDAARRRRTRRGFGRVGHAELRTEKILHWEGNLIRSGCSPSSPSVDAPTGLEPAWTGF